jgi:hypothetical protein
MSANTSSLPAPLWSCSGIPELDVLPDDLRPLGYAACHCCNVVEGYSVQAWLIATEGESPRGLPGLTVDLVLEGGKALRAAMAPWEPSFEAMAGRWRQGRPGAFQPTAGIAHLLPRTLSTAHQAALYLTHWPASSTWADSLKNRDWSTLARALPRDLGNLQREVLDEAERAAAPALDNPSIPVSQGGRPRPGRGGRPQGLLLRQPRRARPAEGAGRRPQTRVLQVGGPEQAALGGAGADPGA